MPFETDLRACVETETARTGETFTALARRAGIPPNSLIRFMNPKMERGLKLETACQLIDVLNLRLVPNDEELCREHLIATREVRLSERNLLKLSAASHRLIEQARKLSSEMEAVGNDFNSLIENTSIGVSLTIPEDSRTVPEEELAPRDPRGGRPIRVGVWPESHFSERSFGQSGTADPTREGSGAGPTPWDKSAPITQLLDNQQQLLHEAAHMAFAYLMRRGQNINPVTLEEIQQEIATNLAVEK
jgi:hypothetical protein